MKRILAVCLLGILTGLVTFYASTAAGEDKKPANSGKPVITINSVPKDPPGPSMASEPIKGIASDADTKKCKVVVYSYGDKWYVQPTEAEPLIDIKDDGSWESDTHGGTKFVALLVKSSYKPANNPVKIPEVGGSVLAVSELKKPSNK